MKVAILTTFYNFDSSYSLCSVVQSQLVSLLKYGYNPVLFVHDNFENDDKVPKGVEIRKVIPRFNLIDYSANQTVDKDFGNQVKKIIESFEQNLKDIDVIFEHDLIFQGWFLPYCVAIHQFAKTSKIKWFHWVHSVPSTMPANIDYPQKYRYQLPENSKLVYLNNYDLVSVAEAYGRFPKDVRIVHNPRDPRLFWELHPLVEELLNKYPILEADFVQVYPVSTPRMVDGKGLYTIIDIMSKLKKLNKKVCLMVCNAHANAEKDKELIRKTISIALEKGLTKNELIFTSLERIPEYELGVPKEVVSELFSLSNLFIFPSISENCSLILLEAMLSKCLLVLNADVPSMREFGKENALYFGFGSNHTVRHYDDREKYMEDIAKIIISEFETNKALKAANDIKQNYNHDAIFQKQILPLLHEL